MKHSVDANELPGFGPKAKNVTVISNIWQFIYRNLMNKYGILDRSDVILENMEKDKKTTVEVQNTESVKPPQDEMVTISYIKINHVAEPYGSNGLRINTGPENMEVPRKDSLNMVNKMDKILKTKIDSIYNKYRK
jgi:hypothetical protein